MIFFGFERLWCLGFVLKEIFRPQREGHVNGKWDPRTERKPFRVSHYLTYDPLILVTLTLGFSNSMFSSLPFLLCGHDGLIPFEHLGRKEIRDESCREPSASLPAFGFAPY